MKTECIYCGKEFDTIRDSAKYCSNSCRTSANKQRRKNEQHEIERKMKALAQKEKDEKQKLIDDDLRKQKAEKRKKEKEEKEKKAAEQMALQNEVLDQQDLNTHEPEVQDECEQKVTEEIEQKKVGLRPFKDIRKEIENKRRIDVAIQNSNLKLAGYIMVGGIAFTLLDSFFNPPKNESSL